MFLAISLATKAEKLSSFTAIIEIKYDLTTPFVWVTLIFPVCVHYPCLFLPKIGKITPKILCEKIEEIMSMFPEILGYFSTFFTIIYDQKLNMVIFIQGGKVGLHIRK